MTCQECLHLVRVADPRDMAGATAIARHCAECTDCGAVVQTIYRDTSEMANLLGAIASGVDPRLVARRAAAESALARRVMVRRMRAGALTVLIVLTSIAALRLVTDAREERRGTSGHADEPLPRIVAAPSMHSPDGRHLETFELRCLSYAVARRLIHRALTEHQSRVLPVDLGPARIAVQATPAEMTMVREVLERFDDADSPGSACPVRPPQARAPADLAPSRAPQP